MRAEGWISGGDLPTNGARVTGRSLSLAPCEGDRAGWNAGHGGCTTYAIIPNHGFCGLDTSGGLKVPGTAPLPCNSSLWRLGALQPSFFCHFVRGAHRRHQWPATSVAIALQRQQQRRRPRF